jgi:hypothetical protein
MIFPFHEQRARGHADDRRVPGLIGQAGTRIPSRMLPTIAV